MIDLFSFVHNTQETRVEGRWEVNEIEKGGADGSYEGTSQNTVRPAVSIISREDREGGVAYLLF